MTKLFISDLHLQAARPDITERFFRFLETEAAEAEALYILGDLFEAWIGDDDPDEHNREVQAAMRRLTDAGVAGYFMHGNRDFLIGDTFAERTGFTLLDDPVVHDLYGTPVLLSHGDAYCTDDVEYQAFRRQSRDPAWQQQVLSMSVEQRRALAGQAREESRAAMVDKAEDIMDVNADAVAAALREVGVTTLVHGHTHRPAVHELDLDGTPATRIVLGDWYEQGTMLHWTPEGPDYRWKVL
ncbi:UDP-2,3-diacylglucosamine diphosphatase [Lentisalinibacter orientalis]|uniref:UDP-2,3-diacylglucosamine diphosphatase n=1 Tax=Lentisalinibacter orientalis TaxID=2992241 RepID=UPI00386EFE8E